MNCTIQDIFLTSKKNLNLTIFIDLINLYLFGWCDLKWVEAASECVESLEYLVALDVLMLVLSVPVMCSDFLK